MATKLLRGAILLLCTFSVVACCNRGKSRSEVFAVLDKYRLDYGKCEVIAKSSGKVNGQEPWLAATACRGKHLRLVLDEVGDSKNFNGWFEEWKKERGPKAVEDARSTPSTPGDSSGNDCPNGAGCLNRCRSECETKHGKMTDVAKISACAKSGKKPEECVAAGSNNAAVACFRSCRGI
jgi:hypothetical protein